MRAPGTIAVLDMEWTTWEGAWERGWDAPGEFREVVQIGFVFLDDDAGLREAQSLQVLVRPTINPDLSEYFVNLTGVTQALVDAEGISLADAMEAVRPRLGGVQTVYSMGFDGDILRQNCERVGIDFGVPPSLFRDVTPLIATYLGDPERRLMSCKLPEIMAFPPPGTAHDAVADCRCIAEALRMMRRDDAF